jgi:hypothetical protein
MRICFLILAVFVTTAVSGPCDNALLQLLRDRDSSRLDSADRVILTELEQNCSAYRELSENQKTMYDHTESAVSRAKNRRLFHISLLVIVPLTLFFGFLFHWVHKM